MRDQVLAIMPEGGFDFRPHDGRVELRDIHDFGLDPFEVGMRLIIQGAKIKFLVHEEGRLLNLPPTLIRPWDAQVLLGPVLVVQAKEHPVDGEIFTGMPHPLAANLGVALQLLGYERLL